MKKTKKIELTQIELLKEFFEAKSKQDIETSTVTDWAVKEYDRRTGKTFRDPGRGIRTLCEKGFLEKVKTGVYRKK